MSVGRRAAGSAAHLVLAFAAVFFSGFWLLLVGMGHFDRVTIAVTVMALASGVALIATALTRQDVAAGLYLVSAVAWLLTGISGAASG